MKHALTAFLLAWGLCPATAATFSPKAPCPGCNIVLVSYDSLAAEDGEEDYEHRKFDHSHTRMEPDYRLYTRKRGLRARDGWKLIDTLDTGRVELYNLKDDPKELKDRLFAHDKTLGVDPRHWEAGCSPVYADQCH